MKCNYDMLAIIGPTAGGKTSLATQMASLLKGEIISADSRQVYRGMDLGTGKDIEEYIVNGINIPYHLIDIVDAGYKYNVFEYQQDFLEVYQNIRERNVFPVLCGGSGMYIESVLKGYKLLKVPPNNVLRKELEQKNMDELIQLLNSYKTLHNKTDTDSKKRIIRAIEIEKYYDSADPSSIDFPEIKTLIVGVKYERDSRRKRITERLKQRLEEGMIDEVQALLDRNISADDLVYYGLEYKFVTQYLKRELSYKEMFKKLETAIHQFAKRQMTWFRGMERKGFEINWLDGYVSMDEKTGRIKDLLGQG